MPAGEIPHDPFMTAGRRTTLCTTARKPARILLHAPRIFAYMTCGGSRSGRRWRARLFRRRAASWCATARDRALPSCSAARTTAGCCRAASSSATKIRPPARAAKSVEETGHRVKVHEFLGAITYRARGRPKVVQFWRMQAYQRPSRDVMKDIVAVEWLAARRGGAPAELSAGEAVPAPCRAPHSQAAAPQAGAAQSGAAADNQKNAASEKREAAALAATAHGSRKIRAAIPPQALPKFNPRSAAARPFPNAPFTAHSREKWNLAPQANVIAASEYRRKCLDRSFNGTRMTTKRIK